MAIKGVGWEILIERKVEQRRSSGKRRTVGKYSVYHDGIKQSGQYMSGTTAETRGPGANRPNGNYRRVEEGTYPLWTQAGSKYVTIGYKDSQSKYAKPKPGIELMKTDKRTEILIHPGQGYLASIGCINLCTRLPNAQENIDYVGSRNRVIAIIEDMKNYMGPSKFPKNNGKRIPNTSVVIVGEPSP